MKSSESIPATDLRKAKADPIPMRKVIINRIEMKGYHPPVPAGLCCLIDEFGKFAKMVYMEACESEQAMTYNTIELNIVDDAYGNDGYNHIVGLKSVENFLPMPELFEKGCGMIPERHMVVSVSLQGIPISFMNVIRGRLVYVAGSFGKFNAYARRVYSKGLHSKENPLLSDNPNSYMRGVRTLALNKLGYIGLLMENWSERAKPVILYHLMHSGRPIRSYCRSDYEKAFGNPVRHDPGWVLQP